jgi:phosphoglycolate phosphatase
LSFPKAVLFDLDGTLSDSLPDIAWALNDARIDAGLTPVTDGQVKGWVGGGAQQLVARSLGLTDEKDPRVAPLLASFLARYEAHAADESKLYPGVAELLDLLEAKGILIACTTNKPASAARSLLDGLGILSRLDVLVTPETCGGIKKPDPRFLATALAKLRIEAKDALVVGDAVQDVQAARAGGIRCVAILGGYGAEADLRAAGADEYVATIAEFAKRFAAKAGG